MNKQRKRLFWGITILIPFISIAIAEVTLRASGYGGVPPLFRKEVRFGEERFVVNAAIGQRYFNLPPGMIPEAAADESFRVNKTPETVRIFCLGGSTTAGFPFEINATFPFQLQYRLRSAQRNNAVEVVNLGISAVNSFTVLDLLPEVLEKQPDALIVYMGHNEFYGAYGSGSTQSVGSNRTLIKTYLALKKWRIFQLLENTIGEFANNRNAGETNASLMQAMAARQQIAFDDPVVRQTRDNFEANLREIVQQANAAGVPVVLSTLVSNLRDHQPFIAGFSTETDENTRKRLAAQLLEARANLAAGQPEAAQKLLNQVAAVDSTSAELHFLRGQVALQSGDKWAAYRSFSLARDLDMLRFRAPEMFNDAIREIAETEKAPLVDLAMVFRAASPDSIPGNNLFMEHLHPNFRGYQLMAESFLLAIQKMDFPRKKVLAGPANLLGNAEIERILQHYRKSAAGVTPLDVEFGKLRSFYLTHRWPFSEASVDVRFYQPAGDSLSKATAIRHLRGEIYWDAAHYELADAYRAAEAMEKARAEIRAVAIAFPENHIPDMKFGDLYFHENNLDAARRAYEKGLAKAPGNPFLSAKLGNTLVMQNRFQQAMPHLETAVSARQLDQSQRVSALYLLGLSYANLRSFDKALAALDRALQLQPGFAPAAQLQQQIRAMR